MIRFNDILDKVSPYYTERDITQLQKAYVFAARAHKGQVRRSGEPYLSHPLEVASMLADMQLDAVTLTAALLHDVLEDTDVTPKEIQQEFGKDAAHLVEGVTKISLVQESSPESRHAETIRKIILAMTDDLRVIFIKLADRIHNLKTLKFLDESKQTQVAQETLEIYAPIANRLGMGRIKAELENLAFRYVNPEHFFKIQKLVAPLRKDAELSLEGIKAELEELMQKNRIRAEIVYRIKRSYSIFNKMKQQEIDFDQVYDFMALRLLTNSVKNCYAALGIIHQRWPHLPARFRDFIAMPKPNHYQALHTTIIAGKKQTIEIQIRTHEMHDIAEHGIAAHWKYKESLPDATDKDDKRLQWLREMAELYQERKSPREFLSSLKTNLIPEEAYVFTPKGKIITLPLGATALDFAFKIHSEIGLHAHEARIDSKPASLKTVLKPGSIVEVLTSPDVTPGREWLNIAFTSTARHHLRRWLNQQERAKHISLGRTLWRKEAAKFRIPSKMLKEAPLVAQVRDAVPFRIRSLEDLYILIGSGRIILDHRLMEKIFPDTALIKRKEPLFKKVVTRVTGRPAAGILVKDREGSPVNLAKCCAPIKGEPIIGYITSGKGITVHAQRCHYVVKELLDSQRMVDVTWDEASKGEYRGALVIVSQDTPGVLAKLTAVIAKQGGNITQARVDTSADGKGRIRLVLSIRDIRHLDSIITKAAEIKEIESAKRD
ncbi:MAG: bifunctional (p)ppGpp synthetase/guanosine-3',5'-bis(diphosphate) 3'-pyrophosphohydrolase [Candidatus Aminicenantaceae bacterium]